MWKKKHNVNAISYNIYSIKPKKRGIPLVNIIIMLIILIGLIVIAKNSINTIKISKEKNTEQQKQLEKLQIEQKNEDQKEETLQLSKLPQLTDEGKQNIENIYHSETKRVFLTFDDGPSKNTIQILDILKQQNLTACFFMLGNNVEIYPDIVKRMYEEGHYLANHGYSHVYSSIYSSPESVLEEYNKCNQAIQNAIGIADFNSHLFRYPGGLFGGKYAEIKQQAKQLLNDNGIVNVDWNALTGDSEKREPTKEFLMERLQTTIEGKNSIVLLMHDAPSKTITIEVLPEVITYLREQGYEFKSFYEIIK